MKAFIRKFIPRSALLAYHRTLAWLADFAYSHPSRRLIIVGVTGTKGKTTTSYLIAKLLEAAGFKTGLASTALFKVGEKEWLNATKMTMLGRFRLQRLLRDMVRAEVTHAVVETSSEGILQSRHRGIWYDVAVFTNLTPDHLEAHGSFEAYRDAKLELFHALTRHPKKILAGKSVERVGVVNDDDPQSEYFELVNADRIVAFKTSGLGFEEKNRAAAVAAATVLGIPEQEARRLVVSLPPIPGRMERIECGQPFTVIVDYAHEPSSFEALFQTVKPACAGRIIHVFGPTGGGRDRARRPSMGRISSVSSDRIIITTDDPYDDDPQSLASEVLGGIALARRGPVSVIIDRRQAIALAISEARSGDCVLITGKGSEQTMVLGNGKTIPWDDRAIVREILCRDTTNSVKTST